MLPDLVFDRVITWYRYHMSRSIMTEDNLIGLGVEEHYDIERKAGIALDDLSSFRTLVAKAVCAFANFGGGYLILGQRNNKVEFDGLPETYKDRPTHEWLNQLIPELVVPTLSGFRVWPVTKNGSSIIPEGFNVYVVEVPDSPFAPHQTKEGRQYFYRAGCNSRPAPHFYLEALRSRFVAPILKISGFEFQLGMLGSEPEGRPPLFRFSVRAALQNEGRVACHRWAVKYEFIGASIPQWTPHDGWITGADLVLLHSQCWPIGMEFGLPMPASPEHMIHYADQLAALTLRCFAISERGPGEPIEWPLAASIDKTCRNTIVERCVQWFRKLGEM